MTRSSRTTTGRSKPSQDSAEFEFPRPKSESSPEGSDAAAGHPLVFDSIVVGLVLVGALSLVALFGIGSGSLIGILRTLLLALFGWGSWMIPVGILAAAWLVFRFRIGQPIRSAVPRWIALELAVIGLLGLLAAGSSTNLAESEKGGGGGVIGWGIAYLLGLLLPVFWQVIILLPVVIGLTWWGLGLSLERVYDRWGGGDDIAKEQRRRESGDGRAVGKPASTKPMDEIVKPERNQKLKVGLVEPRASGKPGMPAKPLKAMQAVPEKQRTAKPKRDRALPPLSIFESGEMEAPGSKEINHIAATIEKTLSEFDVPARVVSYRTGPTITQFGVEPGFIERPAANGEVRRAKVRVSQISSLSDDLALALAAPSLRIEAPVPGQSYVGIEVPHRRSSIVRLRNVMESPAYHKIRSPLAVALGMDVAGQPLCADLAAMPHLLIAGTTGSGKSVCITALIACLVANHSPEQLRLVLIDPKMVELIRFNGLPHILGKVETDQARIVTVLRWCTKEMDRRYMLLEKEHARHIEDYNHKVAAGDSEEPLPRMVILLDEMADLMMSAPDETERTLIRLAQMARAVGIHLVVATQRPSTDVVTGLIKANFPARIAFAVASSIDSRVILDTTGAETLLGKGDMLFLSPEAGSPVRLQGCYVADKEIQRLIDYWKDQYAEKIADHGNLKTAPLELAPRLKRQPAALSDQWSKTAVTASESGTGLIAADQTPWEAMVSEEMGSSDEGEEGEIEEAIRVIKQHGKASASLLQRKMRLGYPRAAHLMDVLQERGIIGRQQSGGKNRELLVGPTTSGDDEE